MCASFQAVVMLRRGIHYLAPLSSNHSCPDTPTRTHAFHVSHLACPGTCSVAGNPSPIAAFFLHMLTAEEGWVHGGVLVDPLITAVFAAKNTVARPWSAPCPLPHRSFKPGQSASGTLTYEPGPRAVQVSQGDWQIFLVAALRFRPARNSGAQGVGTHGGCPTWEPLDIQGQNSARIPR